MRDSGLPCCQVAPLEMVDDVISEASVDRSLFVELPTDLAENAAVNLSRRHTRREPQG